MVVGLKIDLTPTLAGRLFSLQLQYSKILITIIVVKMKLIIKTNTYAADSAIQFLTKPIFFAYDLHRDHAPVMI